MFQRNPLPLFPVCREHQDPQMCSIMLVLVGYAPSVQVQAASGSQVLLLVPWYYTQSLLKVQCLNPPKTTYSLHFRSWAYITWYCTQPLGLRFWAHTSWYFTQPMGARSWIYIPGIIYSLWTLAPRHTSPGAIQCFLFKSWVKSRFSG